MSKVTFTSIFATDHTSAEDIQKLIEIGLPLMSDSGKVAWSKIEEATGINYSRGWLIVRRAYLEANLPNLIIDTVGLVSKATQAAIEADRLGEFSADRDVIADLATELRAMSLSWGEMAVRLGLPESKVRSCYKLKGGKKDLGLRIGKGGRHAYDDPTLYRANRKAEGAYIDPTMVRKPHEEELLNYVAPDAPVVKVSKPRAKKTA